MSGTTPALAELLQTAIDNNLYELHTACPGQVTALYTDTASRRQFADVRPALRRALPVDPLEGLPGPFAEESLPVLPKVPIAYPQGGGFAITWPLSVGDFVLLVFAERSIDQWLATAQKSQLATVPTGDLGTHTLDGAIALPLGPAPFRALLQSAQPDALVIGHDTGKRIAIGQAGIKLGSPNAADAVALASRVNNEFTSNNTDITNLVNATGTAISALEVALTGLPAPGPIMTAFTATVTGVPHTPATVASSIIGAE